MIGLRRPDEQWVRPGPDAGDVAPQLPMGSAPLAPQLLVFLRHVGCPFAELAVRRCRDWALAHPKVDVCIVSHGGADATLTWLSVIGGLGRARLVVDEGRILHGQWGLGFSGFAHFGGPKSLWGVMRLWRHGIRNRHASGTRWQRSGVFLVCHGRVQWRHVPASAEAFALPPYTLMARLDGAD